MKSCGTGPRATGPKKTNLNDWTMMLALARRHERLKKTTMCEGKLTGRPRRSSPFEVVLIVFCVQLVIMRMFGGCGGGMRI